MDIEKLMARVVERWPLDEISYPNLKIFASRRNVLERWPFDGLDDPEMEERLVHERRVFALRHILMHQAKALGKLLEAVEPCDHGAQCDEEKLRLTVRNFFINTLRMAEVSGMTADDLVESIRRWAGGKI